MATIVDLPAASVINAADEFPIAQGGTDKRLAANKLPLLAADNTLTGTNTLTKPLKVVGSLGDQWSIDASGPGFTIPNGSSYQVSPAGVFSGEITISNDTDGQGAKFFLSGGNVDKISDPGNVYAVGADVAGKTCVFYFSGQYFIQNKTGGSRTYHVFSVRLRAAS